MMQLLQDSNFNSKAIQVTHVSKREAMVALSVDDSASSNRPADHVPLQAQGSVQSVDSTLVAVSALFAVPADLGASSLLRHHPAHAKVTTGYQKFPRYTWRENSQSRQAAGDSTENKYLARLQEASLALSS